MRKIAITLIVLLICTGSVFTQNKKRNIRAEGKYHIEQHLTLAQVKEKALFEAKKNALRKAGIGDQVTSTTFVFTSDSGDNDEFIEEYNQIGTILIGGMVVVKDEKIDEIPDNHGFINAEILCDVYDNQQQDLEFALKISDIEHIYKNNDKITFSVMPTKDCFLRFFWFDNTGLGTGGLIYPYISEEYNDKDVLYKANSINNFPPSAIDYFAEKHTQESLEKNIIFIVGTKKQIPFVGQSVNYNSFFRWYNEIPSDEKTKIFPLNLLIK